jgi:hypothetical protein
MHMLVPAPACRDPDGADRAAGIDRACGLPGPADAHGRIDASEPIQAAPARGGDPQTTGTDLAPALIAAAVAIGRLPGEPAIIIDPIVRPGIVSHLFGLRTRRPLSDPRLEILRAISASLARGVARIGADLVAAAHRRGWSDDDLRRAFPGVALEAAG